MRRIRLVHVNLLIFAIVAVVGIAYSSDLAWGARALYLYSTGGFPTLEESDLRAEAYKLLQQRDGDLDRAHELLQASLAIEPYTDANYMMGLLQLRRGQPEEAYRTFERYTEIDSLHLASWLARDNILRERGDHAERLRVLDEAIAHFEQAFERYQPRFDPEVADAFNQKAQQVHGAITRGMGILGQQKRRALADAEQADPS